MRCYPTAVTRFIHGALTMCVNEAVAFLADDSDDQNGYVLSLHDALPICWRRSPSQPPRRSRPDAGLIWYDDAGVRTRTDRKSTRLNSSHVATTYAVFCLKKKNQGYPNRTSSCIYSIIIMYTHASYSFENT